MDVYPVGDAFSYTDIATEEAPVADDGITRELHGAVVEFEASGRWPRDAVACRKVAAALLVQAREELLSDLGIEAEVGEDFLDVRYPEVAFRVRVFHPHELGDVAQRVTSFQAPAGGSASPSAADLARLRDLWWRPRIRNALHSHALRQPALAGAARLCKRWMASQMLSGYDEFVEHLVAHVFLHPAPFDSPTSPQAGFCRFCSLLDAHDWQHEPLMLDFDGRFSEEERMSLRRSFERSRSESERTTYFWVSSRFDPHAMLLPTPPATVCAWLQQRARHALGFFGRKLIGEAPAGSKGWQPMFALDTGVFDVVLRLRPRGRPEGGDSRRGGLARRRARTEGQALRSLVEKVRANLSPVCLVFYDAEGWWPSSGARARFSHSTRTC
ncbi:unnamed protein product [Prorocentrum cordatum]|uniref:Uncharacterized protein n=1 Tax=Prorocentrum cordatum TaxID=2364126 RepID=A0ABN9RU11_9DINO|nr:unnamed protein product [Polarella glacialis]